MMALALSQRQNVLRAEREAALQAQLTTAEHAVAQGRSFERLVSNDFLELLDRDSPADVQRSDQVEHTMRVFFGDIRGFTSLTEKQRPTESFAMVNGYRRGS